MGIPFEVVVSDANEDIKGSPYYVTWNLAMRKARAVRIATKGRPLVIAADTMVYINGEVFGKPANEKEAFKMLKTLQGRCHTVFTGVAVTRGQDVRTFVDEAKVYFRELSDLEIKAYIATGEPFDKAGAYGIQDRGALLVDRIDGDYFTVVGLPIAKLALTLREMGVEVWNL